MKQHPLKLKPSRRTSSFEFTKESRRTLRTRIEELKTLIKWNEFILGLKSIGVSYYWHRGRYFRFGSRKRCGLLDSNSSDVDRLKCRLLSLRSQLKDATRRRRDLLPAKQKSRPRVKQDRRR
jgi:hypothetical protein